MLSSPYYNELHHINPDYTNQPKGQFYPLTHWPIGPIIFFASRPSSKPCRRPRCRGQMGCPFLPGTLGTGYFGWWIMQLPESSNGFGSRHLGTNGPWWTGKIVAVLHLNPSVFLRLMILHHIISQCLTAALVSCFLVVCVGVELNMCLVVGLGYRTPW